MNYLPIEQSPLRLKAMLSGCSLLWFCQFPCPPGPRGPAFLHQTHSICYQQTSEMFASSPCAQRIYIYPIIIMMDVFSSPGDLDCLSGELRCCCFYLPCLLLSCMLLSEPGLHLYLLETTSLINMRLEISYRLCSCCKTHRHVFLI